MSQHYKFDVLATYCFSALGVVFSVTQQHADKLFSRVSLDTWIVIQQHSCSTKLEDVVYNNDIDLCPQCLHGFCVGL